MVIVDVTPTTNTGCSTIVLDLSFLVCSTLLVLQVRVEDSEWVAWSDSVPKTQLEPHRIVSSDVVITTTDTVR